MSRLRSMLGAAGLALVLALGAAACGSDDVQAQPDDAHEAPARASGAGASDERLDPAAFHADLRKLWEDHVTWTRLYLVSAIAGLPDVEATAGRLLQNQADIGEAVAGFYGDDAGAALTELLREHILIAADLVSAAKTGDAQAVATQSERWYANGDEIADFLAGANPAWPAETLREMMRGHLDQTLAEATARLDGDWDADIAAYDRIHLHILQLADALADGIVEQFPERFAT